VFLIVLLAIVAVLALLSWVLVRKRERAGWFPQRPDSSLGQPGDGHAHHSGHTDYGGGHLGGGHESGGHLGGGHGF
jgi:hypothetical protein